MNRFLVWNSQELRNEYGDLSGYALDYIDNKTGGLFSARFDSEIKMTPKEIQSLINTACEWSDFFTAHSTLINKHFQKNYYAKFGKNYTGA